MQMKSAARITREPCVVIMDDEINLMLRVQRDEPGAFAELVESYGHRVFGRLYRQLGDRQWAEDMTQNVFLRLYRSRHRYEPKAKFTTWLYRITQNVLRNALRTQRRRPMKTVGPLASIEHHRVFSSSVDSPPVALERTEMIDQFRCALSELGQRQRSAIQLQFDDHSYSEIADVLDMTPKAAKSLLYRARNQLRELLTNSIVSGD